MKKGITFMALVIMIAIILTLTTTAVVSGVNSINNSKKIKFATELSYVQEIMNSYRSVKNDINFTKTYSIDISKASQDVKEQFNTEIMSNGKITLYCIDMQSPEFETFNKSDLTYGKNKDEDDIYLYSIDTGRVYYKKGLELNGKLYYTLNDELLAKIDYDLINNEANNDIIFVKSTDEWTNISVKCELKISKLYGNINFYKDNVNLYLSPTEETMSYYVYNLDISENCSLKLECKTTDGKTIKKTYDITNIDRIVPTIEVSDILRLIDSDKQNIKKSIQILKKYDGESGIKVLKYEKTKIDSENIKSYFLSNGIVLDGDSISISDNVQNVTIYIEDNAGNYNYIQI